MTDTRKRLMILGAGVAQYNLLNAARELGYYSIVCDARPEMQASKEADRYYQVNYMDKEAILKIALEEKIDGVISNSEPAMESVSYLVDVLSLPGNSTSSVRRLLSKNDFRKLQSQIGAFCPKSFEAISWDEIEKGLPTLKYPIIIKPSESSGSRGATRFDAYDQNTMIAAFYACQEFSRNNYVTVEEFVTMKGCDVYNADVFLVDGKILWDGWYGGKRPAFLPMVPMTKVLPPIISDYNKQRIESVVERLIAASGLSLGEFNVETYLTDGNEIFVIEINPRQAGDDIPKLIHEHSGIDLTRLLVSLSVNDRSYYEEIRNKERDQNYITLQVVFPHKSGVYKGLFIHEDVQQYVRWMNEFIEAGTHVETAHNAEDSIAYIDMVFDSRETQIKYTDKIEEYIYPIIM